MTTATSPRPSLSVAAIPRPTTGRAAGRRFRLRDGLAGPLGHGGQRLHDVQPESRREPGDVVDGLDDVRRARRAGLVVGGVGHGDPAQRAQVRQEIRIVEDRRDGLPPARLADQREIADRQPGRRRAGPPSRASARVRRRSTTSRRRRGGRRRSAGRTPARDPNGGSPGHQTVTGRSWMISGVTIADRCRPASPPAVRWIVSAQVSGASSRGSTQCASTRASSHDGPSGSADWTTIVRDGCRPVSAWIVAAPRSAISGRRAMTTRFITLVRAAMWRAGSPSISVVRSCLAQIRASSRLRSRRCCGRVPTSAGPAR